MPLNTYLYLLAEWSHHKVEVVWFENPGVAGDGHQLESVLGLQQGAVLLILPPVILPREEGISRIKRPLYVGGEGLFRSSSNETRQQHLATHLSKLSLSTSTPQSSSPKMLTVPCSPRPKKNQRESVMLPAWLGSSAPASLQPQLPSSSSSEAEVHQP